MGCLMTHDRIHRHAYQAGSPAMLVTAHAVTASHQGPAGPSLFPLTGGVATFAADGAPYYNSGYLPGYPARILGRGIIGLRLPRRAAQVDLTDTTSWDRPVIFPAVM